MTPHASFIALDVAPQQAYANIQALRTLLPGPVRRRTASSTRSTRPPARSATVYLVLDQSMIMAALDNALNNRAIQRDFARDPVSWAAHTYLELETLSLGK